jgi:hypothetical protein
VKDDAPRPAQVPKKARQMEQILDRWIAEWLAGDTITPSERRRLEALKAERKAAVKEWPVALLIGPEGASEQQAAGLSDALAGATEIHMPFAQKNVYQAARGSGATVTVWDEFAGLDEIVRALPRDVGRVVALPRSREAMGTPAWEALRLAKHRGLRTTLIFPDGDLQQGDE